MDTPENHEPTAVCVVVFNPQGQILAVTRKDNTEALGLPGGKIEPGETPLWAAIRECEEETGITPVDLTEIMSRKSRTRICTAFLAKSYKGDLYSSEEGIPMWVPPMDILNGPFKEYNDFLLKRLTQMGFRL